MEDDGIGIYVVKKIRKQLMDSNIEVIIGETDFEYCLSLIEEGDFILLIDAAYYGKNPGEITVNSLKDYKQKKKYYTAHNYSIVDLIKLHYKSVKGYIIGIEIKSVSFKLGLSMELENQFHIISKKVVEKIFSLLTDE